MGVITTTATTLTEANLVTNMSLTTESRSDPDDSTKEQYRSVMRVDVERDAFDITGMSTPSPELVSVASITCRFNEVGTIIIYPITDGATVYEFKLVSQTFTPKNQRGSQFFNLAQGYTSVSDWSSLEWL